MTTGRPNLNEAAGLPMVLDAQGLSRAGFGSVRHIRRMDSAGKLPRAVRLGQRKVWPVDELRRWLAAGAPPRAEWDALCRANQ